jgi:phosphoribosylamine--glycine ligase
MRFLGVGDYCDLASMYLRLTQEGHDVKISIAEPLCQGTLAGMVQRVDDWRSELSWIRDAGEDGIVLFENVADQRGEMQDALRADGLHVVGGSAFGDKLENDRVYAQEVLRSLGLPVAPMFGLETLADAAALIEHRPGCYVLKFNGDEFGAGDNYVGRFPDGRDVLAMIAAKFRQSERERISFVLMDYVSGVEMGVGAYFDGEKFLTPACLDWEHKRFFPGDLGELTGEMGTVVTFERTAAFFEQTLARMAPLLKANRYCGYINLNSIVNDEGIWPLEFTCRFGYPGYAILEPLQNIPWSALHKGMVQRSMSKLPTFSGFAVGIVMTTRPFPYVRTFVPEPIGLPIMFDGPLSDRDRRNIHFGEIATVDRDLVTAGYHGWTMVVTGAGASILEAQREAYSRVNRVIIPNVRYRNDIGTKLIAHDFSEVERLGLLD